MPIREKTAQELREEVALRKPSAIGPDYNDAKIKRYAEQYGIPLEREATPPRRAKTIDELRRDIKEKNPKLHTDNWEMKNLLRVAPQYNIPLERATTPPKRSESSNRKMTADEQTADFNNKIKENRASVKGKYSGPSDIPVRPRTPLRARSVGSAEYSEPITRREEQNNMGELLATQRQPKNPVGILKSSSRSMSPLLETINSIRRNPTEIFSERERAIAGKPIYEKQRSKSAVRFDRDRHEIDTQMWNRPTEPYEEIQREELPNVPEEGLEGYIDKNMKLPANIDATQIAHGPLWGQQFGKGIAEATLKLMSKKHQPYMRPTVADLSAGEQRARDMALYHSPFSNEQLINEEHEIEDRIHDVGEMPGTAHAAAPYMEAFQQNPAELHESLLGDVERNQLNSIREESDRNLYDKLLPELKRKYLVPGMKRSGHLNKEVRDLIRDYSKGRTGAIDQAMTQNRLGTLGVAQKHASLQGNAAQLAAENTRSDTKKAMETTDMLSIAKKQRNDTRKDYIKDEERRGMIDRDLHQRKMNEDQIRFIEAREHPTKQLAFGAAINRGLDTQPFLQQSTIGQLRQNPNAVNPNLFQNVGAGMAGLAAERMPKKKGGAIKLRRKHADGGQIMQEAVQNAVIDRDDPLMALRRLMNRQRMMDVSETKIGKRRYRDGGQVNPIQAGANQAREFLGEKDLRAHIESRKTPYQKPAGTSMMDSFMRGVGSLGGTTGLGAMARGYNPGAQARDAEVAHNRAEKDKAFMDIYNLDQNAKAEQLRLNKEKREERRLQNEERKFLSDEKYRNADLGQKKEYHQQKLAQGALNKLDDVDKSILADNAELIRSAPKFTNKLNKLEELSKKIHTGGLSSAPWSPLSGPRGQSMFHKGTQGDYDQFDKLANGLVVDATKEFGSRGGARIAAIIEKGKPNRDMSPEGLAGILKEMKDAISEEASLSRQINEDYAMGISPKVSLGARTKDMEDRKQAEREEKNLGSQKLPEIQPAQNRQQAVNDQSYLGSDTISPNGNANDLILMEQALAAKRAGKR